MPSSASPGTPAAESGVSEQRSLTLGVVASLVIALLGLVAYALSGSDALLLDGLYSGVMAGSSLIAARIGANVDRPPDRGWPFGYEGQEALYVLFRSLVLIGVLSAAVLAALREITAYTRGHLPPGVDLGPVGWYTALTVMLCLALAGVQRRDWIAGGRRSELLRMESQAAALDAAITAVAGGALLAAPLLRSTPLAPLEPISDAVLVLLLAAVVVAGPVKQFLRALHQAAGAACEPELIARVRQELGELLHTATAGQSVSLLDLSLLKVGRTTFLVAYLDPSAPVDGRWMDALRRRIEQHCGERLGPLRTELILTARSPFSSSEPPVENVSVP
ncbi:MAG: cation transporter [Synechococcaceae cyanobacterium]|nr:cation transporter [Synechococcaceae cyanobacterium]